MCVQEQIKRIKNLIYFLLMLIALKSRLTLLTRNRAELVKVKIDKVLKLHSKKSKLFFSKLLNKKGLIQKSFHSIKGSYFKLKHFAVMRTVRRQAISRTQH